MHILINLAENGHHGCDIHCPFCEWSRLDYGKYYFPSDDELDQLIINNKILVLSGGGDPLYHFSQNYDLIKHFVDYVSARGVTAGIYSHDLPTLWQYRNVLRTWPVAIIISINLHPSALESKILSFYHTSGQLQHISVVLNPTPDTLNAIDALTFAEQFGSYAPITFREHWTHPYPNRQVINDLRLQLKDKHCSLITSDHYLSTRVWFEGHLTTCGEIDQQILGIKKMH